MKKNLFGLTHGLQKAWESKLCKLMRTTLFLVIVFVTQSFALDTYSQNTRLTLKMSDATLKSVLGKIEDQSEFYFMYEANSVDVNQKVSVKTENQLITDVLDQVLTETGITYKIHNRQIALSNVGEGIAQQGINVSGIVTSTNGEPIPGATVIVKGTTIGTVTNVNGEYFLSEVPADGTLSVAFVGMKTLDIAVSGQSQINIVLEEDLIGIEEVVAVGYGTIKKVNLTGSLANVTGEVMTKRPATNSANLLQGRLTGVDVIQPSAEPGRDNPTIRIRGLGSYGASSSPLILIDGVSGSLSNLAPNDIETINVLKDAASAAIYGARAANGVILVTTKKGKKGEPTVTYSGNLAIHSPTRLPDFVTNSVEYMEMWNSAVSQGRAVSAQTFQYSQEMINNYRNAPAGSKEYPNFDGMDYWFKNARVHNHSLSVSGGSDKSVYNTSFSYLDQNGMLPGYSNKRYNLLFSYTVDIKDWLTLGTTINITSINRKEPSVTGLFMPMGAYLSVPLNEPYAADGSVIHRAYLGESIRGTTDPIQGNYAKGESQHKNNNLNGQIYLELKPFKGLTWTTKMAMDYRDNYYTSHQTDYDAIILHDPAPGTLYHYAAIDRGVTNQYTKNITPTLYSVATYETKIDEVHDITVLAGYEQISSKNQGLKVRRPNGVVTSLKELDSYSSVDQIVDPGNPQEWALQSLFARVNYGFKNKYLFEANLRYDGTSKISPDNRWGVFPSVSAGWVVSEESFIKDNVNWLDFLKLRGSYGVLGNSNINQNYAYQANLKVDGINYPINEKLYQGAVLTDYKIADLRWESTRVTDIGLDLNIKNGLLGVTFDWFNRTTYDILAQQELPRSVGLGAPWMNDGEMVNKGVELSLIHRNKIGELNYSANVQFSQVKNEVTDIRTEVIGSTIRAVGHPWNEYRLYQWDGIFQESDIASGNYPDHVAIIPKAGDLKMKDVSGPDGVPDGIIDSNDQIATSGRYPDFNYSFGIDLDYKNWGLNIFFQGVQGRKELTNYWTTQAPFMGGMPPTTDWRNAWTPENPTNDMPAIFVAEYSNIAAYANSTYFLRDASYLRLKNIMLSYSLPTSLINRAKLQDVTVFVSGENLLTFTKHKDQDPESGTGTVFASWPQAQIFNFGINVKF